MKDKQLREALHRIGVIYPSKDCNFIETGGLLHAHIAAIETLHKKVDLLLEHLGLEVVVKKTRSTEPYILVKKDKKEAVDASNK